MPTYWIHRPRQLRLTVSPPPLSAESSSNKPNSTLSMTLSPVAVTDEQADAEMPPPASKLSPTCVSRTSTLSKLATAPTSDTPTNLVDSTLLFVIESVAEPNTQPLAWSHS